MYKGIIFSLFILILTGCATPGATLQKNLEQWVGYDVSNYIATNGTPKSQMELPNGNTVYEWIHVGGVNATATNYGYMTSVNANQSSCRISITANENDTIERFSWQGHCGY